MSILTNANGTPMTAQPGIYPSFNATGVAVPGITLAVKKGILKQSPFDATVTPYTTKRIECLELNFPYAFVEILDAADRLSWFTFRIKTDREGNKTISTARTFIKGTNDSKDRTHAEYLSIIADHEGQQRNAAAAKADKEKQIALANARSVNASELKGLKLKAMTDLKKAMSGMTAQEMFKDKQVQKLAESLNVISAILIAI